MWRFNDVSIRAKLYSLVLVSTAGLALVVGLSYYLLATYRVSGPLYKVIASDKDLVSDLEPAVILITQPYLTLQELETASDSGEIKALKQRFDDQENEYNKTRADWLKRLPEGDLREGVEVSAHQYAADIFRIAHADVLPNVGRGDMERAKASKALREEIAPRFQKQRQVVDGLAKFARQQVKDDETESEQATGFWLNVMLAVSAVAVLLIGIGGWLLARNIVGSTAVLMRRVGDMAAGSADLTARVEIDSKDEIGQLAQGINAMIAKSQVVVQKVRESSIQLLSTASEISATARQQEQTMQELGSSTAEIAAAVREITQTSKELSGTMSDVNGRANEAASLAASGRSRLAGMEGTMQQLVESTRSISAKLALIREKADNINVVVTTITKVADQTNLLSINAAIEAEKAGEYGRGFLVVAREIRRLADQTAVATLDIENMVRLMHEAVSGGVMQMDKFSEEVRSGVGRVAEINGQTGQIIEEVSGLSERFRTVNEGMRNQSLGAEQINEAMVKMAAGTRQTAASLEEFNRATAHLRHSVELLNKEVAQFTA